MSGGRRRIVEVGIQCDQCGLLLEKQGSPEFALNALAEEIEASGWQTHTNPRDPGVWGPLISDRMPQTVEYKIPDLCPRCMLLNRVKDKMDPTLELLDLDETLDEPYDDYLDEVDIRASSATKPRSS